MSVSQDFQIVSAIPGHWHPESDVKANGRQIHCFHGSIQKLEAPGELPASTYAWLLYLNLLFLPDLLRSILRLKVNIKALAK